MLPHLVMLLLLFAVPAWASPVDRVVAVVESELVLASEVRIEAELAPLDHSTSPFWDATRSQPLERLIDAAVVRIAAADVALYQPPDEDIAARREAIHIQFTDRRSWEAFLQRHGLDEDGLEVVLRRRMVVERYLSRNVLIDLQDRAAWLGAAGQLLSALRERMRVRRIDEESQNPPLDLEIVP